MDDFRYWGNAEPCLPSLLGRLHAGGWEPPTPVRLARRAVGEDSRRRDPRLHLALPNSWCSAGGAGVVIAPPQPMAPTLHSRLIRFQQRLASYLTPSPVRRVLLGDRKTTEQ